MVTVRPATIQDAAQVAAWLYAQWGHLYPNETAEDFHAQACRWVQARDEALLVADAGNGELAGCLSITHDDVPERPDVGPWISNLYIAPRWRGSRVLHDLTQTGFAIAQELGFSSVYCVALRPSHFRQYARYGFEIVEVFDWHGAMGTLMRRCFEAHPLGVQNRCMREPSASHPTD